MRTLVKGGNTRLALVNGVVVGVAWPNVHADTDVFAILCTEDRRVRQDTDFIYFNAPVSMGQNVVLHLAPGGSPSPVRDRAQILIDLPRLEPEICHVFVVVASAEQASLASAGPLSLRVFTLDSGRNLADYDSATDHGEENATVMAEIYRHRDGWKVRIIDQGYADGLTALGRDFGVEIQ